MVSGEHFGAIGMTEPGGGSDLKALRTRARRDGDHYVIDGAKTFITNGATCSLLVLACRTGGEGARGVSMIVLETDNLPGFSVGRRLEKLGMRASDTAADSAERTELASGSSTWAPASATLPAQIDSASPTPSRAT